jgi:ABC-type phosphate transport system substrate-binding protein
MKKLLFLFAMILFTVVVNAQVSVIANKSVTESINLSDVANIYSLTQTKWSDGKKIVLFDNSSDVKDAFYSGIGKDQLGLKKVWLKKQLTGEAKAPETLGSDEDIIAKINSTPGAIGFVKSSSVSGKAKVLVEIK